VPKAFLLRALLLFLRLTSMKGSATCAIAASFDSCSAPLISINYIESALSNFGLKFLSFNLFSLIIIYLSENIE
jgi:hypothetical protein